LEPNKLWTARVVVNHLLGNAADRKRPDAVGLDDRFGGREQRAGSAPVVLSGPQWWRRHQRESFGLASAPSDRDGLNFVVR
jgi:hypothetical protein